MLAIIEYIPTFKPRSRATKNTLLMKKIKLCLEYLLKTTSKTILWDALSTPAGLESWFADKVSFHGDTVAFQWGKSEERIAHLLASRTFIYIRFRWAEGRDDDYFEFRINQDELTGDYILTLTDKVYPEEADDMRDLWDSQIVSLKRAYGF